MTNAALRGKPDAGNPHVRFDEGEVAPAATPRRGSLLYKLCGVAVAVCVAGSCAFAGAAEMCDYPIKNVSFADAKATGGSEMTGSPACPASGFVG